MQMIAGNMDYDQLQFLIRRQLVKQFEENVLLRVPPVVTDVIWSEISSQDLSENKLCFSSAAEPNWGVKVDRDEW